MGCPVCGKNLRKGQYYCSKDCVDISEGEGPRKPAGFVFGCDSPHKKQDPGHDYMSNEERRVYRRD